MYRVCLLWASLFELKAIENTKKSLMFFIMTRHLFYIYFWMRTRIVCIEKLGFRFWVMVMG